MKVLLGFALIGLLMGCETLPKQVLPYVLDDGQGGKDLYLYDLETGTSRALRQSPIDIEYSPSVDPTGAKVVFVVRMNRQEKQPTYALVTVDLETTIETIVDTFSSPIDSPVWSNNGKHIAYVVEREGKLQVEVREIDSTKQPTTIGFGSDPSWRVDDRAIFFSSRDTPDAPVGDLTVYELKTGLNQSLALRGNGFSNLARGTSILYTTLPYSRRNEAVWIIDANNQQRRLTSPGKTHRDTDPVHINGTKFVAFTRTEVATGTSSIYVVERYAQHPVETLLFEADVNTHTKGRVLLGVPNE